MKERDYVVTITRTYEVGVVARDEAEAKDRARDALAAGAGTQIDEDIEVCGPDDE